MWHDIVIGVVAAILAFVAWIVWDVYEEKHLHNGNENNTQDPDSLSGPKDR